MLTEDALRQLIDERRHERRDEARHERMARLAREQRRATRTRPAAQLEYLLAARRHITT
jgi:hypothetical protein